MIIFSLARYWLGELVERVEFKTSKQLRAAVKARPLHIFELYGATIYKDGVQRGEFLWDPEGFWVSEHDSEFELSPDYYFRRVK